MWVEGGVGWVVGGRPHDTYPAACSCCPRLASHPRTTTAALYPPVPSSLPCTAQVYAHAGLLESLHGVCTCTPPLPTIPPAQVYADADLLESLHGVPLEYDPDLIAQVGLFAWGGCGGGRAL